MDKALGKYKWIIIGLTSLLVVGIVVFILIKVKNRNSERSSSDLSSQDDNSLNVPATKETSIVIGDSQTPYIDKPAQKVTMLGPIPGGEKYLWKGGENVKWLIGALKKYPITPTMKNVVINIGTNGGFNKNDDIKGLVSEVKRVFPKAKLYAVQGSWGWGGNINVTTEKVNAYYDRFRNEGVEVLNPPIGVTSNPHGHLPIYKEIGKSIDSAIVN